MPAPDAGIQVLKCTRQTKNVDGRNKSGHDAAANIAYAVPTPQPQTPA